MQKKVPFLNQIEIKYFASVKTINTFARTKKEAKTFFTVVEKLCNIQ